MIGGTTVTVNFTATGPVGQMNSRLYDVAPDGTTLMVDRGPRRLSPAEVSQGSVTYQLHGNGWRFAAGHRVKIELAQDDDPFVHLSETPSSATLTGATLKIPVREAGATIGGGPSMGKISARGTVGTVARPRNRVLGGKRLQPVAVHAAQHRGDHRGRPYLDQDQRSRPPAAPISCPRRRSGSTPRRAPRAARSGHRPQAGETASRERSSGPIATAAPTRCSSPSATARTRSSIQANQQTPSAYQRLARRGVDVRPLILRRGTLI